VNQLGRYLVIGFAGGEIEAFPANHILLKEYDVVGVHLGAAIARRPQLLGEVYHAVRVAVEAGAISPIVGPSVTFADAPQAFSLLSTGSGKPVIRVAR
jgi:NADPH2:quinone reductase